MKRILIIRGGTGIGDLLWTTPVARLLALQGHLVDVAVWPQNQAVYESNPWIRGMTLYPENEDQFATWQEKILNDYDQVIKLDGTCEKRFLHRTDGYFGPIPTLEERRAAATGCNYITETVKAAGLPVVPGETFLPELYSNKQETEILTRYQKELTQDGRKIVFWNITGSTKNKFVTRGLQYIKTVLTQVPNSKHWILSGIAFDAANLPDDPRIQVATWDLRTSLLLTKLVDLVVGTESALVSAAGAWDTPKVVFYSHSAPENLGAHFKNHYPIRPLCDCHPCYLIPLTWSEVWDPEPRVLARSYDQNCRVKLKGNPYKSVGYHCTWNLPDQEIIDTIVKILT